MLHGLKMEMETGTGGREREMDYFFFEAHSVGTYLNRKYFFYIYLHI